MTRANGKLNQKIYLIILTVVTVFYMIVMGLLGHFEVVAFETVNLAGGSILVTDPVTGCQFILAKGWREIDSVKSMADERGAVCAMRLHIGQPVEPISQ